MSEAATGDPRDRAREVGPQGGSAQLPRGLHVSAFDAAGPWVTRFWLDGEPVGGEADLTRDQRFEAWVGSGVSLKGKRVLELGPLEGGHTLMLCRHEASEVVSVEGRAENYRKCCIVKNVFGLDRATLLHDDVANVTSTKYGTFDVVLASGILYHLRDPMRVISQLAALAPVAMVWTHVATDTYPRATPDVLLADGSAYHGKWYHEPNSTLAGLEARSFWPFLSDLRRMFRDAGFCHVDEIGVDWNHAQGAGWLGTVWRDALPASLNGERQVMNV